MKKLIVLLLTVLSIQAFSQIDTVFTNGKKIPCNVKEITPDAIKFSYVGEDVINSIYMTSVQKIIYKSGRIQIFSESKSYKDVTGAEDFEKVTITSLENDITGMSNFGDISSKAQAGTVFTGMDKVIEKADKRLKIQAAMLGANIIYLTQSKKKGYSLGTNGMSKSMVGIAFSDRLPNFCIIRFKVYHPFRSKVYQCSGAKCTTFLTRFNNFDKVNAGDNSMTFRQKVYHLHPKRICDVQEISKHISHGKQTLDYATTPQYYNARWQRIVVAGNCPAA